MNPEIRHEGSKYLTHMLFFCMYSFLNVSHWIVELKTHTYTCSPKVILCGNKIDLYEEHGKVDSSQAKNLCKDYQMPYIETSAFTGQGLNEAMEVLRNLILTNIDGEGLKADITASLTEKRRISRLFSMASKDEEWETTLAQWKDSKESFLCCR